MDSKHVIITGGAGYIGSLLTGALLNRGHRVTVVDNLQFGGESLLGYWQHPGFRFRKADIVDREAMNDGLFSGADAVVHLAAVVGFPACKAAGDEKSWSVNFDGTRNVFEAANAAGVERFIYASTYSNYGIAEDDQPVTEDSPLHPQSLYAETKIAAEQYLLSCAGERCAPLVFRFATLFGVSPRTRFDLIINQFVWEALTKRELMIYQRGYSRSFVHIRDVAAGVCLALDAPLEKIRGQVYNLGSDSGNYTKDEVIELVKKHIDVKVTYKDLSFDGDMRNVSVSFAKIRQALGFDTTINVEQGIVEVRDVIEQGVIKDSDPTRYLNARLITH